MVQVNNLPYVTLRIRFKKLGRLQYISHLDLVRTMSKILVRAKLPMWYTEGFNPKPKMIFAAPLSIGVESVCEFMDVRLTEKMDPAAVMSILNKNMTDEMQVLEAYYPKEKFTELKWLKYTMKIGSDMKVDMPYLTHLYIGDGITNDCLYERMFSIICTIICSNICVIFYTLLPERFKEKDYYEKYTNRIFKN